MPRQPKNSHQIDDLKEARLQAAGALGLKTTGTVSELATQLKSHLSAHPEIQHNP
jgi:hypothetical protein